MVVKGAERAIDKKEHILRDAADHVSEEQFREDLLELLREHYRLQNTEMPIAMYKSSAEQLRRYWNVLGADK